MPRNILFGRRVRMRRKQQHMEWVRLSELALIGIGRLELIEDGQLDETDLTQDELALLACVLNVSPDFLCCGYEKSQPFLGYPVGNRSRGDQVQEELRLDLQPNSCPICREPVNGSRCRHGHFQE